MKIIKCNDKYRSDLVRLSEMDLCCINVVFEIDVFNQDWDLVIEDVIRMFVNDTYVSFNSNLNRLNLLYLAAYKCNNQQLILSRLNQIELEKGKEAVKDNMHKLSNEAVRKAIDFLSNTSLDEYFNESSLNVNRDETYMNFFEQTLIDKRPDLKREKTLKYDYFLSLCKLYNANSDFIDIYEKVIDTKDFTNHLMASEIYISLGMIEQAEICAIRYSRTWKASSDYEILPVRLFASPIIQRIMSNRFVDEILKVINSVNIDIHIDK